VTQNDLKPMPLALPAKIPQKRGIVSRVQEIFVVGEDTKNYVNGHMRKHCYISQHPIAISEQDLSIWCFLCDSYIVSPVVEPARLALYQSKFGEAPPSVAPIAVITQEGPSNG